MPFPPPPRYPFGPSPGFPPEYSYWLTDPSDIAPLPPSNPPATTVRSDQWIPLPTPLLQAVNGSVFQLLPQTTTNQIITSDGVDLETKLKDLLDNTEQSQKLVHEHSNMAVLDKLSCGESMLLYDGKPINDGKRDFLHIKMSDPIPTNLNEDSLVVVIKGE